MRRAIPTHDTTHPSGEGSRTPTGRSRGSVYYVREECVVVPLSDRTVREALHDLRWRCEEMLADGPGAVIVEVSGLTRLSSATVAALLWAKRRCASRGVGLLLVDPDDALAGQLHRAGLHTVWDIRTGQLHL